MLRSASKPQPNGVAAEVIGLLNGELWDCLLESLHDSPGNTQRLILLLGRKDRPVFGSVTVSMSEGRISLVDVRETFK